MESFASRLKEIMMKKQLKPSDLSRLSHINQGTITHYMHGKYEPRQDTLTKLATILNVDEAWLMGYDVPMRKIEKKQLENYMKFVSLIPIYGVYTNQTKMTVLPTSDKDNYFYIVARNNNLQMTSRIKENDLLLVLKTKGVKSNDIIVVKESGQDYFVGKFREINKIKYLLTDNEEIVLMPAQLIMGKVVRIEINL